jgi:hypothetical protein
MPIISPFDMGWLTGYDNSTANPKLSDIRGISRAHMNAALVSIKMKDLDGRVKNINPFEIASKINMILNVNKYFLDLSI